MGGVVSTVSVSAGRRNDVGRATGNATTKAAAVCTTVVRRLAVSAGGTVFYINLLLN